MGLFFGFGLLAFVLICCICAYCDPRVSFCFARSHARFTSLVPCERARQLAALCARCRLPACAALPSFAACAASAVRDVPVFAALPHDCCVLSTKQHTLTACWPFRVLSTTRVSWRSAARSVKTVRYWSMQPWLRTTARFADCFWAATFCFCLPVAHACTACVCSFLPKGIACFNGDICPDCCGKPCRDCEKAEAKRQADLIDRFVGFLLSLAPPYACFVSAAGWLL